MKQNILFLCVANSARSQMAEGLAKSILGESANVQSAGSEPGVIHPTAIQVLAEIGIDIKTQYAKSIQTIDLNNLDYIITLCAEEYCPYINTEVTKLHWPIHDPAAANANILDSFRKARDEIKTKLEQFKQILKKD